METRPLRDAERRYLEWHEKHVEGPTTAQMAEFAGCFAGCFTLPVSVGLLAGVASLARGPWTTKVLTVAAVFAAAWLVLFLWMWNQRRKGAALGAQERQAIRSDLAGGVAAIRRFRATAVLLAYGPKRRERNYFVRVDDGRVLFLGGWKPPACTLKELSYLPDEKGFPSAEFDVDTGPESRLLLDVVGRGDFLRPADEFDLAPRVANTRSPKSKLKSGELVPTPWDDLRKTYGT
jgi:hypothetical protein